MRQNSLKRIGVLAAAVILATACGRDSRPPIDDALKNDLALASQSQPSNAAPTVSPYEAAYASQQQQAYAPRPLSTVARTSAPARRAPARRATSSSASSGSGGSYPAQTPPTTVEKHTQRDAAIGAAAGAIIGATSSRNKIQGGLIGAAIGGILGGVVGNNVDVKRKTGW